MSLRNTLVLYSTQGKCFSCQRGKRDVPRHSTHYGATRFLANIYHPVKFKFEMKQLMPLKHSPFDLLTPLPPIPCTGWATKWVGQSFLALPQLKGKRSLLANQFQNGCQLLPHKVNSHCWLASAQVQEIIAVACLSCVLFLKLGLVLALTRPGQARPF